MALGFSEASTAFGTNVRIDNFNLGNLQKAKFAMVLSIRWQRVHRLRISVRKGHQLERQAS